VADGALDAGTTHCRVFPGLNIVSGEIDATGKTSNAALEAAVASADMIVAGPAPACATCQRRAASSSWPWVWWPNVRPSACG